MISDNDKTETFSINDDETQTFNPEIDITENCEGQKGLPKPKTSPFQKNSGLYSGKESKDSKDDKDSKESKTEKAEEIRKKLKYMEHILDIETL